MTTAPRPAPAPTRTCTPPVPVAGPPGLRLKKCAVQAALTPAAVAASRRAISASSRRIAPPLRESLRVSMAAAATSSAPGLGPSKETLLSFTIVFTRAFAAERNRALASGANHQARNSSSVIEPEASVSIAANVATRSSCDDQGKPRRDDAASNSAWAKGRRVGRRGEERLRNELRQVRGQSLHHLVEVAGAVEVELGEEGLQHRPLALRHCRLRPIAKQLHALEQRLSLSLGAGPNSRVEGALPLENGGRPLLQLSECGVQSRGVGTHGPCARGRHELLVHVGPRFGLGERAKTARRLEEDAVLRREAATHRVEAQLPQHRVDLGTHVVRLNRSRLGALSDPLEPAGYAQRCGAPQPEGNALEWRACAIAKRRIDERL